jgi:hypothetical protein
MTDALSEKDDLLHPPVNTDPYWTETVWFGAHIPERKIGVNFFMLFRTNLGIVVPSLFIWGPGGEEIWSMPYQRTLWHALMPKDIDATNFTLPAGFEVERIKWLDEYRVRYRDENRVSLDLHFESLGPPVPYGVAKGYGHLDQYGRVTGEIVLDGERMEVNCLDMRDRTWSPRRETSQTARIGYTYGAASPTQGFQIATKWHVESGEDRIMLGFLLTSGGNRLLTRGTRDVRRDDEGRPIAVDVRLYDEAGKLHVAHGEVVSRFAMPTTPYFVWMSLVRWTMPDGSIGWGQDQDTWAPAQFRALRQAMKRKPRSD